MKLQCRNISEVSQQEKVQIHFKFNDLKAGYAEIAREHLLDNCDIYTIVKEIETIRANRAANPQVKAVYRRNHINKKREVLTTKKEKSPRPDNRQKTISRELDLNTHWEKGDHDVPVQKRPYQPPRNQAMALALKAAFKKK